MLAPIVLATAMLLAADGGAAPDGALDASAEDAAPVRTAPVPLAAPSPSYPAAARASRHQGTVLVRLDVDETGAVTNASVVSGVDPDIDAAALEAARRMRFEPAREGGRPIAARIDWLIEFKLPEPEPPPSPPPEPTVRLEGQVLERGTRRPVVAAVITAGVTTAGETDGHGRFAVDLPCGRRHLGVQAPRFEVLTVEVDACAAHEPLLLRLERRMGGPSYETVIRSEGSNQNIRLESEELTRTPGTLGDPFRAIESLPGVTAVQWPLPIYAVRGSNPGNTGFFLDDVRIPTIFHFALGPSVIHPYFFDSLSFYPGGYPAHFGRYVGGIVAAETRAPAEDAVHSSADVRLFDAGAMFSSPFPDGQGSVAAAARYSYTAGLISLLNESVALDYWDYQLRAQRKLGPVRLTLLVFGSGDRLAPKGANQMTDELVLQFHRASLRADLPVGGGRLVGGVTVGTDHTKSPFSNRFPITVDASTAAPRLAYRHDGARAQVEVGFDGELAHYAPTVPLDRPGAIDLVQSRDAVMLAGYASVTLHAGQRLVLTPELRFDRFAENGASASDLGPRLSARLALGGGSTWLRAAGGRFTQMPSMPLQIPGVENFGLDLYGLQSSWQGSLGVGTTRLAQLEIEATGFVQRYVLTDVRVPSVNMLDPLADDFLTRRDALSYGIELLVRRSLSERLHGWISYTLSNNLRAIGNGVIAPSDWDQRHVFNLVLGYRRGKYTFGGRLHLNTGRPVATQTPEGFTRLPTYYQLDLRLDRRFVFDRFILDFYLELQNATLTRQVLSYDVSFNGTLTENTVLIALPSIGLHGEF
jgi:TonB family protein